MTTPPGPDFNVGSGTEVQIFSRKQFSALDVSLSQLSFPSSLSFSDQAEKYEPADNGVLILVLIGFTFFLTFTAFLPAQTFVTTLYSDIGSFGLSSLYFAMLINTFFSTLIVNHFGSTNTYMFCITAGYPTFIACCASENKFLFLFGCLLCGSSAAHLWTAQGSSLAFLSSHHNRGVRTSIFMALFRFSFVGNLSLGLLKTNAGWSLHGIYWLLTSIAIAGSLASFAVGWFYLLGPERAFREQLALNELVKKMNDDIQLQLQMEEGNQKDEEDAFGTHQSQEDVEDGIRNQNDDTGRSNNTKINKKSNSINNSNNNNNNKNNSSSSNNENHNSSSSSIATSSNNNNKRNNHKGQQDTASGNNVLAGQQAFVSQAQLDDLDDLEMLELNALSNSPSLPVPQIQTFSILAHIKERIMASVNMTFDPQMKPFVPTIFVQSGVCKGWIYAVFPLYIGIDNGGYVFALFGLTILLCLPAYGVLFDKMNSKKQKVNLLFIPQALCLCAVSLAMVGRLLDAVSFQYISALLFGLAVGGMDTISYSIIIYCFQTPKTSTAFSSRLFWESLGQVFSTLLGPVLLKWMAFNAVIFITFTMFSAWSLYQGEYKDDNADLIHDVDGDKANAKK